MKKLLLMLALSLGGIVSAQSFDFSCDTATDVEVLAQAQTDFDIFQDPLFVGTQTNTLEDAEFLQGNAHISGVDYPNVNHFAWTFVYPNYQVARVAITVGEFPEGMYQLEVFQNVGGSVFTYYPHFGEAWIAASLAQQAIDTPGFTNAEAAALIAAEFTLYSGGTVDVYNHSNDYLSVAPVRGGEFTLINEDYSKGEDGYSNTYATIAEVIAAVQVIIG